MTVSQGTNTITGTDPDRIVAAVEHALEGEVRLGHEPELWDGRAAERIAAVLRERLA